MTDSCRQNLLCPYPKQKKEVTVCFEADNWDILGIENMREGVDVSATDLEGKNSNIFLLRREKPALCIVRIRFWIFV